MTRRFITILLTLHAALPALHAQKDDTGYQFLEVPTSAHSAALGGMNVSIIEDDATLMFTNPALITNVSDKTLNLNFTSYISSSNKLSAAFIKQSGERGTWGIGAMMLNYGEMTETNQDFETIGTFSAKDIDIQGGYTYLFNDKWSGGVQGKILMSNYGEYSSTALAVDLGLNYYDTDHGLSLSIVGLNFGGQIDALYEKTEKLPFNLVAGISKDLANAPIRISVTFDNITNWDEKKPINHLTFGADVFPSNTTWVAIGYNPRRGNEMKISESKHGAGLSLGAGLMLNKFKVGLAWGKYHVAASSLTINTSYTF